MQAGIRKKLEASRQNIIKYLQDNEGKLTDEELNEALDKLNEVVSMLELFDE